MPKVEISVGELFDKLSILDIKMSKISDKEKLQHIKNERECLEGFVGEYDYVFSSSYNSLCEINKLIWDTEDRIREKEKCKEFDDEFIELARSIYKMNDKRFAYKNEINILANSAYREQKSYKRFQED
jgi:hypothetical protein